MGAQNIPTLTLSCATSCSRFQELHPLHGPCTKLDSVLPLRVPIHEFVSLSGSSVPQPHSLLFISISCNNSNTHTLGLINNVLYVIILSAALDLVGPSVPKGVVLLADVIPSFLTKLIAPYFIHLVPYPVRILIFAALSTSGMLLIALTPAYTDGGTIATKMTGVVLASLSSGGGELSFLGLTHFYGAFSLASWGSGTGAAGLVGAGLYALATTALGMTVKATLMASAVLPVGMLVAFFVVLPRGPIRVLEKPGKLRPAVHQRISDSDALGAENGRLDRDEEEDVASASLREDDGLLHTISSHSNASTTTATPLQTFQSKLRRARGLFIP